MKSICSFLLTLCFSISVIAQSKGDELKKEGKLEAAMFAYGTEFMSNPTDKDVAYKLASTLALVNRVDTAFFFLNVALENNNSLMPLANSEFYALTFHEKWKQVEQMQMKKFQAENGELRNPQLASRLISIIMKDQALDYHIHQSRSFYQKNGYGPHWLFAIGQVKQQINKDNFDAIEGIIAEHGWPGYSEVGELAADAPLLVINHHEDDEVRKKYLPQIKSACENGEGSCMEYAKIHDRILVNEGKEQLYGMQFRYNAENKLEPFPIQSPEGVDKRRKAIGLEPLAVYLKRKINYDWSISKN